MIKHFKRDVVVGEKTDRIRNTDIISITDIPDTRMEVAQRIELADEIVSCCKDLSQRFIMYKLLEGGYTIQDIADEMNRSKASVCRIKQGMENELHEKMKGTSWTRVKSFKGILRSC